MEPDNPMLNAWLGMGYLDKPAFSKKAIAYLQHVVYGRKRGLLVHRKLFQDKKTRRRTPSFRG
jgi:hypothetical protein